METFLELELFNFQKWVSKTIRIQPGVTLLAGKSGIGKSTFPRSIHFVLFGGRSWCNIGNKKSPSKKTYVRLSFVSPDDCFSIKRERPSESVTVELIIQGKSMTLVDESAQAWICSLFGTEESWLCSSYLIQDKPHFFIDKTNAEKKDLLHKMTFGDNTDEISPESLTSAINSGVISRKKKLDVISGELKSRNFLMNDIVKKVPDIYKYGAFTVEIIDRLKTELTLFIENKSKLEISLHNDKKRLETESELETLEANDSKIDINNLCNTLNELREIKKCLILKQKLESFDPACLECDLETIKKDDFLYNTYINHGWDQNTSIETFIKLEKEKAEEYRRYLRLSKENESIRKENSRIKDTNFAMKKSYDIQLSQNEQRKKEIHAYKEKKETAFRLKSELDSTNFILFEDDDVDASVLFLTNRIPRYELSSKELCCPHCTKGVIYENGKLQKGTLFSDEMRRQNAEKLSLAYDELEKRKLKERTLRKINEISQLSEPQQIHDIEEPNYINYKDEISFKNVSESTLDIFRIPTFPFDVVRRLISSLPLVDTYRDFEGNSFKDRTDDISIIPKLETDIESYKKNKEKILFYKDLISKMAPINEDAEQLIVDIKVKISKMTKKIDVGRSVLVLMDHKNAIEELNESQTAIIDLIEKSNLLTKFVTSIANSSINEMIESINDSLEVICDELFEAPIKIEISTTKEQKDKKKAEKDMVNLSISYDGDTYDKPTEFSGGELRRISLALVLAFSKINTSPILILDEVLPAMGAGLEETALETIKEWSADKFVIHICHKVTEGFHDHVIEL